MPRAKKQASNTVVVVNADKLNQKATRKTRKPKTPTVEELHQQWKDTKSQLRKLQDQILSRHKNVGLKPETVQQIFEVTLEAGDLHAAVAVILNYPQESVFESLFHGRYGYHPRLPAIHPAVLRFIHPNAAGGHWPKEVMPFALKFLKKLEYQPISEEEAHPMVNYFLWEAAKDEKFQLDKHGKFIVSYGWTHLCVRLMEQRPAYVKDSDYAAMVKRLMNETRSYETKDQPIVRLAKTKGLTQDRRDYIVSMLLEHKPKSWWANVCDIVKNAGSPSYLVDLLTEAALGFDDLYEIRNFLKAFPAIDKNKFREVVRRLLTPDPEEMIDAFLDGGPRTMFAKNMSPESCRLGIPIHPMYRWWY